MAISSCLAGAEPLNNQAQAHPTPSSISKTDARYRARWHSRSAYNARLANRTDMIRLSQVTLRRGAKLLLEGADVALNPGDKIGLIGANGSGKSSLFALLRGELHADKGELDYPARWRVAYVAQETPALERPALEYAIDGETKLRKLEAELAAAEAAYYGP